MKDRRDAQSDINIQKMRNYKYKRKLFDQFVKCLNFQKNIVNICTKLFIYIRQFIKQRNVKVLCV